MVVGLVAAILAFRGYGLIWALLVYSGAGGLTLVTIAAVRILRQSWRNRP